MLMSLSLIGLSVIIVAWILEFFFMGKKKKISPIFIGVYILGAGILVYDGFTSGVNDIAVANLITAVVAGIVLGKTLVGLKD
jgi:hypothetical protein